MERPLTSLNNDEIPRQESIPTEGLISSPDVLREPELEGDSWLFDNLPGDFISEPQPQAQDDAALSFGNLDAGTDIGEGKLPKFISIYFICAR